jgi:uncharacterized protein YdhG (YjbR/CyaY superfamily)
MRNRRDPHDAPPGGETDGDDGAPESPPISLRPDPDLEVDIYLTSLTVDDLAALQRVRKIVRALVPDAIERVRFRVPTVLYHGPLVGYSIGQKDCSFFVMSRAVMDTYKRELAPYYYGPGILSFSYARPLPKALVETIVRARMAENEANRGANPDADPDA